MKSRLNYLVLALLFAVAVILPARADSYKGTMTCLGTKMEYSFSGGVVTNKELKGEGDQLKRTCIKCQVEAGTTVTASFKKIEDYKKNPEDVSIVMYAIEGGKRTKVEEKRGKNDATASYRIPENATKVEVIMEYHGRVRWFACFIDWDVVKEISVKNDNEISGTVRGVKGGEMHYSFTAGTVLEKKVEKKKGAGGLEYEHAIYKCRIPRGTTVNISCKGKSDMCTMLTMDGSNVKSALQDPLFKTTYQVPSEVFIPQHGGNLVLDVNSNHNDTGELDVVWEISDKGGEPVTPKSFTWDDEFHENFCPFCKREFSKYFFHLPEIGHVEMMCYHDDKYTRKILEQNSDPNLYYRDWVITHTYEGRAVLDYCDEDSVLIFYGETSVLLAGRLDNGNDRWVFSKGRIVGKHIKNRKTKQVFEMSQCTVVPTGTTYMLVEDGKTSRAFLLEGSMEVTSKKGSKKTILKPGQVATVSSNGKIKTQKFDVAAAAKKYDIPLSGNNVPKNGGNKNKKEPDNKTPERNRGNDVVKKDDTGGKVKKCKIKGVEFSMIKVESGTFTMGATKEQGNHSNQHPTHKVTLSTYYIGETEVTQELWEAVMGTNPSKFKGAKLPVENVSWTECQQFINKINQLTGRKFRLPTEAEWEFAARGGKSSKGYKFAGSNNADAVAWHQGNSGNKTHNVGTKAANELGLYDMCGNVWEWCQDWFGNYSSSAQTNPKGPSSGTDHLNRGGAWCHESKFATVFYRGTSGKPDRKVDNLGFRLVLEP